jgi:tetratricopeptide (TPR) repeat protein
MSLLASRHLPVLVFIVLAVFTLTACFDMESRKQRHFDRGVEFFETGDDVRARLEFRNLLQIDDRSASGWYWMGRVEERGGDLRRAFANYNRAVELDGSLLGARIRLGQLYLLGGDVENAERESIAGLSLAPEDPDALMLRAGVRLRAGDPAGSEEDARTALEFQPGHAAASVLLAENRIQRGDQQGAISLLERAIDANPDVAELRLILGGHLDNAGDVEGAIAVLHALVDAHPEIVDYRSRLAGYLAEHGREAEAEQVLRDALAQVPDDAGRQQALIELVARLRGLDGALEEVAALRAARPGNLDLRLLEAGLLASGQRTEDAEAAYRSVIEASGGRGPIAIRARTVLAALLAPTRPDEAAALIAEVLAESASEPDALEIRAALALGNDEPDQAIRDLRTVLREFPDRIAAQRMLGQAHAARGEVALAEDTFERTIRMAPTDPVTYLQLAELRVRNGDNEGALVVLENLLARVPESEDAQQAIARIQFSSEDWDALGQTAERIQRTRPEHALGFYLNGLVLQRQGEHEAAVAALEEALERAPDALEPVIALARSQLELGRPGAAAQHVREVLERNPNNVVAMNLLADVHASAGELAQARSGYQEAIRFHPRSPRAYGRLALLEEAQGDNAAAVAVLERGVRETGRNLAIVFQLAMALERSGDLDGAIAAYEEVLRTHPDADVVVNNLAYLLATHRGTPADLDRAQDLSQRFAGSEVAEFLDTLGWILYLRGDYGAARTPLERALELRPDAAELRYHLGMTYARLGLAADAREQLAMAAAAEDFPDRAAAKEALHALER